jgi:tetratricopeptide (TPR) repeat protein
VKKASAELFELVAGLSIPERRYCSLYLQKHSPGAGNRYLKLFQALRRQERYDSTQAMLACGFGDKPTHYAVLKNQLFDQLLDALHQFDLFSNPEQQLQKGIHQCQLLMQKGMFHTCRKWIERLEKPAAAMHQYEAQLQLQQLKMALMGRQYYRNVQNADMQQWYTTTQTLMAALEVTNRYRYLSSSMYKMQYAAGVRGKALAEKMQALVELPEFTQIENAGTLRATLDFLQVNALYHFTNLETEKAAHYNQRFLEILDEHILLKQLYADRYFSVLNNYLIDCMVLRQYATLEDGLQKMRSLPGIPAFKRLANFDANVFRLGYLLEMNYTIATGNFAMAYPKLGTIWQGLKTFGDKIVKHNRITLCYLMAYTCFALGRYDEAIDYLQPILQEKESAVAENIQLAARMMQLLCHFEKGDRILLDSLIKSVRRLLKRTDGTEEIQRAVLSFMFSSLRKQAIEQKAWVSLDKKLGKLAAHKNPAGSLNLFNYVVWAKAHAMAHTFEQVWKAI